MERIGSIEALVSMGLPGFIRLSLIINDVITFNFKCADRSDGANESEKAAGSKMAVLGLMEPLGLMEILGPINSLGRIDQ